ncbi:unnamed protein product, partial [Heterosigma akashiwo]
FKTSCCVASASFLWGLWTFWRFFVVLLMPELLVLWWITKVNWQKTLKSFCG